MERSLAVTTDEPLRALLEQAHDGRIRVPEFQRSVAVDDDWVRQLLASVSLGYPIGAFMLLEAGRREVRFESRSVEGAPASSVDPEWFLLDGHRRLTALYQALRSHHGVRTYDRVSQESTERRYYIDVTAALDGHIDRDEAVVSQPAGPAEARSTRERFPLRLAFDADAELEGWRRRFLGGPHRDVDARETVLRRFTAEVLRTLTEYRVPVILHRPETARWSIRVHGGPDGRTVSNRYTAK
jgi:hypothetical protein